MTDGTLSVAWYASDNSSGTTTISSWPSPTSWLTVLSNDRAVAPRNAGATRRPGRRHATASVRAEIVATNRGSRLPRARTISAGAVMVLASLLDSVVTVPV